MFALDWALAMVLLTTSGEPGQAPCPATLCDSVRPALRQLAVRWEILDPRETRYVLTRPEDFADDLKMLQRRFRDLKGAPPLSECQRFPNRKAVNELLAWNRQYRQYLLDRQAVDLVHAAELRTALCETERLYRVWDTLRDARCTYYYVSVRRQALKQLRDLVGVNAFYSGQLPPHVPVWRFPEMD